MGWWWWWWWLSWWLTVTVSERCRVEFLLRRSSWDDSRDFQFTTWRQNRQNCHVITLWTRTPSVTSTMIQYHPERAGPKLLQCDLSHLWRSTAPSLDWLLLPWLLLLLEENWWPELRRTNPMKQDQQECRCWYRQMTHLIVLSVITSWGRVKSWNI